MQLFAIGPEIIQAIQFVLTVLATYFVAFTISLLIWTYQDIKGRSRSVFIQLFSVLLVLGLNLPGLLLYRLLRPSENLAQQYQRALEEEAMLQDLEQRLACPSCKRGIKSDFLICPYCRTQLKRPCPRCGQPLGALWKSCPYCTTPVAVETVETPKVALEATAESGNITAQEAIP